MTKKVKIFIGVASAIGVVSAFYFLVYRKRKPDFIIEDYNWDKKYLDTKFGSTPIRISEYITGTFTAGQGYDEKLYSITTESLGKGIVKVTISKNAEPIQVQEIDFDGRLIVDK